MWGKADLENNSFLNVSQSCSCQRTCSICVKVLLSAGEMEVFGRCREVLLRLCRRIAPNRPPHECREWAELSLGFGRLWAAGCAVSPVEPTLHSILSYLDHHSSEDDHRRETLREK